MKPVIDPIEIGFLYADGLTLQEIGERFGLTRERIRQIMQANNMPRRKNSSHGRLLRHEWRNKKRLQGLYETGMSRHAITELIGVNDATLRKWFNEFGIRRRTASEALLLARKPTSPWYDRDRLQVAYNSGQSVEYLARVAGVCWQTAYRWCRRLGVKLNRPGTGRWKNR